MRKAKKGQVGGIQNGFMALMFIAVALVVVIVINAFGADFTNDQQDDFGVSGCAARTDGFTTYNTTDKNCYNSSFSSSVLATDFGYNITGGGLVALNTLADGTEDVTDVGIITIVLALLVALIGIFGWAGYNRTK